MTESSPPDNRAGILERFEALIAELGAAAHHASTCIEHGESGEMARLGAHGLAMQNHLAAANRLSAGTAENWAARSE